MQDECHADPYCPDFIASWRSQLGWLAMHPRRIAQNAVGIIRPTAEIAPYLEQQSVHAISLNLKRQGIDRIAVSEERITCGLAQLTAGKERVTCATINYTRSNCGTVVTIRSLGRWRHTARNEKIRTDPIPDLVRCNRKCASGDVASVATNCEHRRSAWARS